MPKHFEVREGLTVWDAEVSERYRSKLDKLLKGAPAFLLNVALACVAIAGAALTITACVTSVYSSTLILGACLIATAGFFKHCTKQNLPNFDDSEETKYVI